MYIFPKLVMLAPSVPQEAFANIGTSVLTMVNMLAGGIDLTMFRGAHAVQGHACAPGVCFLWVALLKCAERALCAANM